jgi:hypothetical protein
LLRGLSFVSQIQGFNLISGPGSPSQKLEARLDARVIVKTPDADDFSQFIPTKTFYQLGQNHFQRDPVQRIFGFLAGHVSLSLMDNFCFQR